MASKIVKDASRLGRPQQMGDRERMLIEKARRQGRSLLVKCVHIWEKGLAHSPATCTQEKHDCKGYTLRCTKEIADRFGLPAMQSIQAEVVQNEQHELVLTWRGTAKLPQHKAKAIAAEVASNGNKASTDTGPNGAKALPSGDNNAQGGESKQP